MDEIVKEFLVESVENLAQLERDLLALERAPDSAHDVASIFRIVHSIKGSAAFLGYQHLGEVAHAGESVLGRLREGRLTATPKVVASLLAVCDALREMLATIESSGTDNARDFSELVMSLRALRGETTVLASTGATAPEKPVPSAQLAQTVPPDRIARSDRVGDETETRLPSPSRAQLGATAYDPAMDVTVEGIPSAYLAAAETMPPPGTSMPERRATEVRQAAARTPISPSPAAVETVLNEQAGGSGDTSIAGESAGASRRDSALQGLADSTIRVDVSLLDRLMTQVGELVLARNRINQCTASSGDSNLLAATRHLDGITTELQEGMMKTRMQPIRNAWAALPRMVHDLCRICGKSVRLIMEGETTALDKTLLEAIKDPIVHAVRNAVDHGIEPATERSARGKPAEGTLRLRAFHEGGQVHIEISDDGAGIDPERVKRKAIDRGLINPERAAVLSEADVLALVFQPGFTTAEALTLVSGRGVGMDVIKTAVDAIGGRVDLRSVVGRGTTLAMTIPLTLTIVKALVVSAGDERFAIPQANLVEVIRLAGDSPESGIETLHSVKVHRYRGVLLPLVDLRQVLELDGDPSPSADGAANLVVLRAEDARFGLIVDRVYDSQEVVVRPLARSLKGLALFSGATILGDGCVALILDILGLARHARVVTANRNELLDDRERIAPSAPASAGRSLVLCGNGPHARLAIPLDAVVRLERIERNDVDDVGGRWIVSYRGGLLPLIDVARALGDESTSLTAVDAPLQVVVCTSDGRCAGLVVGSINDVIENGPPPGHELGRAGVVETLVVGNETVELLDVAHLLSRGDTVPVVTTEG